jgi:hypothetical protein
LAAASDSDLPDLAGLALSGGQAELEALQALQTALTAERDRAEALEREVKQAYDVLAAFRGTRRYRLAQALGRPLDVLRGKAK